MKFEDYLSESATGGTFAVKVGNGTWKEGIKLHWPNAKAIAKAVNGEKEDIGAISDFVHGHFSSRHAPRDEQLEILDASAKLSSHGDTVTIEFRWTTMKDRHQERTGTVMIQDDN